MKVKRILSSIMATVMVATSLVAVNVSNVWAANTVYVSSLKSNAVYWDLMGIVGTKADDGSLKAKDKNGAESEETIEVYSNGSAGQSFSGEYNVFKSGMKIKGDGSTKAPKFDGKSYKNGQYITINASANDVIYVYAYANSDNKYVSVSLGSSATSKKSKSTESRSLTEFEFTIPSNTANNTEFCIWNDKDYKDRDITASSMSGMSIAYIVKEKAASATATADQYDWKVNIPDVLNINEDELAFENDTTEGADSTNKLVYTGKKYTTTESFPTILKVSDANLDEGTQIGETGFKKYTATVTLKAEWFAEKPTYAISGKVVEAKTSNGTLATNAANKTFTLTNKDDNTITAEATISADGKTYSSAAEVVAGTYKITDLSVDDYSLVSDEVTIGASCSDIALSFNSSATVTKKWDLTGGLVAGDNGNGLYAMEAMKHLEESSGALTNPPQVQGATNPSKSGNNVTGAALKLVPKVDGFWKLSWKTATNKGAAFALQSATSLAEQTESGTGDFKVSTYEVKAGNTYFFYGTGGTKLTYNDITFYASTSDDFKINKIEKTDKGHLVIGQLSDMSLVDAFDEVGISLSQNGTAYKKLDLAKSKTLYSSIDVDGQNVETGTGLFAVLVDGVPDAATLYAKGYALISGTTDKYVEQATGKNS